MVKARAPCRSSSVRRQTTLSRSRAHRSSAASSRLTLFSPVAVQRIDLAPVEPDHDQSRECEREAHDEVAGPPAVSFALAFPGLIMVDRKSTRLNSSHQII